MIRRAPGQALPVLVLTGFLGAGKTTLLNYLLSGLSGARVAALVNDFGAVEVDALNIAGRVDSTISLAGGCMCCEVDVEEVDQALADLAAPEHELDLVVIEASGLAEPDVLAQMVRGQPRTTISYAGLINVVDAVHFREVLAQHPRLEQHLAISDLLVVTKSDLLDAAGRAEFAAFLADRAAGVPVVTAEYGRLDLGLLFGSVDDDRRATAQGATDPGLSGPGAGQEHSDAHGHRGHRGHGQADGADHGHAHLHDSYDSAVAESAIPLHPRRFMMAMRRLPAGVFRAKGTVVLAGEDGPWSYRVNIVGKMLDLVAEGPCAADTSSVVVLIGVDVPSDAADFLDGAAAEPGEKIVPEDRFGLEPYLIAPPDASDASGWIYEEERYAPRTASSQMLFDPDDPDCADPTQTP